ncbi:MAG: SAM hydrolase/SAM-dependent halogenase family protein [Planctomycetota bacterium]
MTPGADRDGTITLLTDFGARDVYAGVMKGVIHRALPGATVVDLTHGVPPQDVMAGALALEGAFPYFPDGTVHVAVVDPGVGGPGRVIAARAGGHAFLGPDNGVLSPALERAGGAGVFAVSDEAVARAQAAALPAGARESSTFHGRDRFAPLAALIAGGAGGAGGEPLEGIGTRVEDYARLEIPKPTTSDSGEVAGEVIYVDGFGNLVTNLRPEALPEDLLEGPEFEAAGTVAGGLARAYVDAERGALLAIVGSTGRVELSIRDGSAAREFGAGVGTPVTARTAGRARDGDAT